MASSLPDAVDNLIRARDVLLNESQRAGSTGNWDRARTLMELAERVDRLREAIPLPVTGSPQLNQKQSEQPSVVEEKRRDAGRDQAKNYPKYLVRDGALVKRGLQRGGHDIYEHTVPQARFDQIIDRLGNRAAAVRPGKQRPFSIEQVQGDLDCPRYMTYVVVSMLLREGLLARVRKGSYTFAAPATLSADAATLWERLKGANIL
jgi:hypothetical protein